MNAPPVLVEARRAGLVEARHRGTVVVVEPDGHLVTAIGDADQVVFLRSSAKPFQLAPFLTSGRFDSYRFGTPTEALAIMAASHSGEDRHVRTVQAILREGGLSRDVLQCGTHAPFDAETAQRLLRDGEPLTSLRHNCSGKHAGMALHAKAAGWPVESYWQPDHPVQQLALQTVATMSDTPVDRIVTGTDGCGVVTFGVPLRGAALAFARFADPSDVADDQLRGALERIRDAMMAHPDLVAGVRGRLDTALMRAASGAVVAKGGAEGLSAVGVLPGHGGDRVSGAIGLVVKIENGDGAHRAGAVAVCSALVQLGVLSAAAVEQMGELAAPPIVDPRGANAGEIRATFKL
ncbi:MAG TPA: asparaginase [Candidatus Limnocylindria bacterium]|nr:asparaginase [Candidatus Limnocylindria bacterium]